MIQYKQGKENIMANALSRRYIVISTFYTKLLGFERVKELYAHEVDFANVYKAYEHVAFHEFYRHEGILLKKNKFCVLNYSLCKLLV